MIDYTKECWYCSKKSMQNKGDYYQCERCGATWNKIPTGDNFALTREKNPATGGTKGKAHPVGRAKRESAAR